MRDSVISSVRLRAGSLVSRSVVLTCSTKPGWTELIHGEIDVDREVGRPHARFNRYCSITTRFVQDLLADVANQPCLFSQWNKL